MANGTFSCQDCVIKAESFYSNDDNNNFEKAVFEASTKFCGNIKLGGSSVSFSIDTQIAIESGATLEMTGGTKIISGSGTITNLGTLTFSNPGMSVLFNIINHGQITFSEETMPPSLTSYGKVAILKNVTVLNEFKARSSSVLEGPGVLSCSGCKQAEISGIIGTKLSLDNTVIHSNATFNNSFSFYKSTLKGILNFTKESVLLLKKCALEDASVVSEGNITFSQGATMKNTSLYLNRTLNVSGDLTCDSQTTIRTFGSVVLADSTFTCNSMTNGSVTLARVKNKGNSSLWLYLFPLVVKGK